MTLENNHTFISPCNQKISRIDTRAHSKDGKMMDDAYRFAYPMMASLVDAVISQEDNKFPCRQFALGCLFDNIVWQQVIGALKNIDHTYQGQQQGDDEHILFSLLQAGLIDHQAFDLPHKWSSRSIHYSAIVAEHLWLLYTAEHIRNDCLEAKLNTLKGEVNKELKKDGNWLDRHRACLNMITDKHNTSIEYLSNMSSQLELQWVGLLTLCKNICLCNMRSDSTEALVVLSPSLSPTPPQNHDDPEDPEGSAMQVSSVPEENASPIPVPAPGPSSRSCCPPCHVQESTTTLWVITMEEEHEIEDRLIGAWQAQGQAGVNASIPIGSGSSETSDRSCVEPIVALTWEQVATLSPEVRGYRLLSMMQAVMMMPNGTIFSRLQSSDHVGGELQLVFPLSQEDFNALMSGELSAEVGPVTISEVVWGGVVDDAEDVDGDDGWVTDRSVAGLE
ncbi:hypothetical protein BDM02DRAFT_3192731 [Thelephora ganbajun]|uniref:Uncharacterized protein n=1 Tax=Thelephora ganbajun TaxID=370292 RepID=A0ACB6YZV1_THEGA|nr:hypothetical protein BDM02DRAFT_3192731 [Thelephora ganbajun]